ncbi:hypothetical protein CEP53_006670 [Fusarium sp. AF-6]|nr:hypothetical protein CEP53_006670 [Fusarium sp. AF-6]
MAREATVTDETVIDEAIVGQQRASTEQGPEQEQGSVEHHPMNPEISETGDYGRSTSSIAASLDRLDDERSEAPSLDSAPPEFSGSDYSQGDDALPDTGSLYDTQSLLLSSVDSQDDDSDDLSTSTGISELSLFELDEDEFTFRVESEYRNGAGENAADARQRRLELLKQHFRHHREELKTSLQSLKDENDNRLYSDVLIEQQLGARQESPQADRGTFGQIAFVTQLSHLGLDNSTCSTTEVAISELITTGRSLKDTLPDSRACQWVHLPANNLEWVHDIIPFLYRDRRGTTKEAIRDRLLKDSYAAIQEKSGSRRRHWGDLRTGCREVEMPLRRRRRLLKRSLSLVMPCLDWENSISAYHMRRILDDAEQMALKREFAGLTADEIDTLPCTGLEKLMRYYVPEGRGFRSRQSLDQALNPTLIDTEARDLSQVVERFSRRQNLPEHRILMVDQLWLWIVNSKTIITCFPTRWEQAAARSAAGDRMDMFQQISRYINDEAKRSWIQNARDLAYFITHRCAGNLFDSEFMLSETQNPIHIFQQSINNLEEFQRSYALQIPSTFDIYRQGQDDSHQVTQEFKVLDEAEDILNEIEMMVKVRNSQAHVLGQLRNKTVLMGDRKPDRNGMINFFFSDRPKERQKMLANLKRPAVFAHKSILNLIDRKLKQASIFQAMTAKLILTSNNKLLEASRTALDTNNKALNSANDILEKVKDIATESEKSGKTMMTFAVITILFLPLTSIASLFSVNAQQLNDGHLSIGVVFAIICMFSP